MPITIPNYQTDNINKKEKYRKSLNSFLEEKKVTSGSVATHTSWGWKNGKYYIDSKEYKKLLKKSKSQDGNLSFFLFFMFFQNSNKYMAVIFVKKSQNRFYNK